jgi:hypothetical protein
MTQADWRLAVYREMQSDLWYAEPGETQRPADNTLDLLDDLPSPRRNSSSTVLKAIAAASGAV